MTAEPLLLASPDAVPVQGVMLPHGLLRLSPFPMGLVPAVVSPRMS